MNGEHSSLSPDCTEVFQSQLVDGNILGLRQGNCFPRAAVSISEWHLQYITDRKTNETVQAPGTSQIGCTHPFSDKVVGQVSGQHIGAQRCLHYCRINLRGIARHLHCCCGTQISFCHLWHQHFVVRDETIKTHAEMFLARMRSLTASVEMTPLATWKTSCSVS